MFVSFSIWKPWDSLSLPGVFWQIGRAAWQRQLELDKCYDLKHHCDLRCCLFHFQIFSKYFRKGDGAEELRQLGKPRLQVHFRKTFRTNFCMNA